MSPWTLLGWLLLGWVAFAMLLVGVIVVQAARSTLEDWRKERRYFKRTGHYSDPVKEARRGA